MKKILFIFSAVLLLSFGFACDYPETTEPKGVSSSEIAESGPLVYAALLTQYGTGDPTAIVLENTVGSIVWTREYQGRYHGTLSGAFASGKTFCFEPSIDGNNINESEAFAYLSRGGTGNYILLYVKDITLNNVDGFNDLAVKIIVYP